MSLTEYEKIMVDWCAIKLTPVTEAMKSGQKLGNYKNKYFPDLFNGYKQISDSFDAMKLSLDLLQGEFPNSISKDKYLKYIAHAFLSDCYIVKEMLKAYANKLQKIYGKASKEYLEPLYAGIVGLEPLMENRNSHVHQKRFTGGGLSELESLSLVATYESSFQNESDEAFASTLDTWIKYMKAIVGIFTGLLDESFTCIMEVVIVNGTVREP